MIFYFINWLSNKKVILSTGMSTIKEIKAIDILAFSNIYRRKKNYFPTRKIFLYLKIIKKKEDYIKNQLTILHCTTDLQQKILI